MMGVEQLAAFAVRASNADLSAESLRLLKRNVLDSLGRFAESKRLARALEQLEPKPPYSFFNRGMAAIQRSDFNAARELFAREIDRAPYQHEFHYWLAVAYAGLGAILDKLLMDSSSSSDHDSDERGRTRVLRRALMRHTAMPIGAASVTRRPVVRCCG